MSQIASPDDWDFSSLESSKVETSPQAVATSSTPSTVLVRICPTAGRALDAFSKTSNKHKDTESASKPTVSVNEPVTLQTLPYDIKFAITKHLDHVSSTCLGLTCKDFYKVHRRLHGSVSLDSWIIVYDPKYPGLPGLTGLPRLLKDWFKERWNLEYSGPVKKFVELERWYELEDLYWGDGWEST
ncbi:hypothetical protein BDZ45DRAFT_767134 [Acephala macrosclerotiorum]|nr:hypothetical protein BDZ45DRAFT_767134 [Acephala macrosclerotiorum]